MSFNLISLIVAWQADGLILTEVANIPDHSPGADPRYRGYVLHHLSVKDGGTELCNLYGAKMTAKARIQSISIHASDPVITTKDDHNLSDGDVVFLLGDDSDHTIIWGIVDNKTAKTFTLPGVTTVAGTALGTVHLSLPITKRILVGEFTLSTGEVGVGPYAAVWHDSSANNLMELLYHEV